MQNEECSSMRIDRPRLRTFGLLIGLLFLALSSLRTLQQVIVRSPDAPFSDEIALYERRAAPLRSLLPASGAVGYISDRDDASDFFRGYYMLRYVYAPLSLVVVGDMPYDPHGSYVPTASDTAATPALIVGDFRDRQRLEARRASMDLVVVAQVDDALFLLCRRGARDAQGAVCR
jgi:hypothetical protein